MQQQYFVFEARGLVQERQAAIETQPHVYTVSELTRGIRGLLEENYGEVWVTGEVSNFRSPASGHFYFNLKDGTAAINAVMFRSDASRLPFKFEDGLELVVHGRVSVYEKRGEYQIVIDYCEPKGIGALQLAFEQLKKKLEAEGLFDAARKKSIPFLPKKIGIVTSPTGAAVRDILNILGRRYPNVDVLIVPVKVQGEGAAQEIAMAMGWLNGREDVDVMIVGRGGGSLEDLWAFNEEIVARAIFASKIPVISAVGHEIDFTIADFVADVRAPTPSAAAEIVVPKKSDLVIALERFRARLVQGLLGEIPQWVLRVDSLWERLLYCWNVGREKRSEYLKRLASNLNCLSPLHILAKGYSVVRRLGEEASLKTAKSLKMGEPLEILFYQGRAEATVERIK